MSKAGKLSVAGFRTGALAAGVRYPGRLDLGLIAADWPVPAAGVFTSNLVKAPSVVLNRQRLRAGAAQAVLVNSGNANTCVGPRGMADARLCTRAVAQALRTKPGLVLMNSTGVIGEPLPTDRIVSAIPNLVLNSRPDGFPEFARAIMTTDTKPKTARRLVRLPGGTVTIAGAAKGAGMIMPNLATMLVYILTDAALKPGPLAAMLGRACEDSFNALTIDGDTSTSDSVIMMASGASGIDPAARRESASAFQAALDGICLELARAIAADGEGATKMFAVTVTGARSKGEADMVARRVANSPLVKTAFHAADPNWGRVMMAVGSAGVNIKAERVDVDFVAKQGAKVAVVRAGGIAKGYSEARAAKVLARPEFTVRIALNQGRAERTIYTCDLSAEYVKINAEYRT